MAVDAGVDILFEAPNPPAVGPVLDPNPPVVPLPNAPNPVDAGFDPKALKPVVDGAVVEVPVPKPLKAGLFSWFVFVPNAAGWFVPDPNPPQAFVPGAVVDEPNPLPVADGVPNAPVAPVFVPNPPGAVLGLVEPNPPPRPNGAGFEAPNAPVPVDEPNPPEVVVPNPPVAPLPKPPVVLVPNPGV